MITCSADIHEFQQILLVNTETVFSFSRAAAGFGRLPLALPLALFVILSGCELLRDEPTNMAIKTVENYTSMTDADFVAGHETLPMREHASLTYLRALREQGGKLSYSVDSVVRDNPAHREVVVIVNEKNLSGVSHERVRYRIELSRNEKKAWQVTSFQLIE